MTLLLETGSHGNVIVDNVITTGNLLHHPHAETRPPRKGDQVAVTAWERKATPKDPGVQWSAYEGGVRVLERIGSRSTVRGGRGAAKEQEIRWEPVSWVSSKNGKVFTLCTAAGSVTVSSVGTVAFPGWDVQGPFFPTWDGANTWASAGGAMKGVEAYLQSSVLIDHPPYGKSWKRQAGSRGVARGTRRAVTAWERRSTPKDPQVQWSAYEGGVRVLERIGSRSTVRGGRGAAKTGREIEREAIEVFVGDIESMTPEQVRQWKYNDILVCPHGGTEFTVHRHMYIFWPPDEQHQEKAAISLSEYSYGEHFGPHWCQCEHADGTRTFFWPPDNLELT
jgi:hypothetical protein